MVSGETIYYVGLVLIGLSILIMAVMIPFFAFSGRKMKRKLEADYGETGRNRPRR